MAGPCLDPPPPPVNSELQVEDTSGPDGEPSEAPRPAHNLPPTTSGAYNAHTKIEAATWTRWKSGGYIYANLDHTTQRRFAAMEACLNYFISANSKHFVTASITAAKGQRTGPYYA
ncbi:hypothetical protein CTheo_8511 [Ceratobasidium theobromae]|uniref:Uncharacterized protein n=1 Tax=Ceratobasidium theobromae TaxID=1582974 RepID=A0A5N5Q9E3_9AGAM|nr:hypothetical protein CTheo_8511 [Ceratobasidium theobromae]